MGSNLNIVKFDRDVNFGLWKVKMEAILVQNEQDLTLEGKSKKPKGMSD